MENTGVGMSRLNIYLLFTLDESLALPLDIIDLIITFPSHHIKTHSPYKTI